MNLPFVQELITRHEGGFRPVVYLDTKGNPTIGIGFNLADPRAIATCKAHGLDYYQLKLGARMPEAAAVAIRDDKIAAARFSAQCTFPQFDALPDNVQAVVIDMIFNMGFTVFREFQATIAAINAGDFKAAAAHMQDSAWYAEVKSRAVEDCALMAAA